MNDNNTQVFTDVYTLVTNRIIELLEAGTVPWRKPWTDAGVPQNLISKRAYRGINVFLLTSLDYEQNLFLTWKQIKDINASVNKGEKGHMVVFQKPLEKKVENEGEQPVKKKNMLRYYKVFNIAQCKDIPEGFMPKAGVPVEPMLECLAIVAGMRNAPKIINKKNEAFYNPKEDYINMPKMKQFENSLGYYSVLFHELIHSTGHQSRVGRKEIYDNPKFGTEDYSMEELTAEIGACYLKSFVGLPIEVLDNHAAYIKGWLEILRNDKRFIVYAASRAQHGVEYILNRSENMQNDTQELVEENKD